MNSVELIGRVGAEYLRMCLADAEQDSTARFIVDHLTAEQTAAIARAILSDGHLAELIELKLPVDFMYGQGLPTSILTDERATHLRHSECSRPARLIANTGDDQDQSLKELTPIGTAQLLEHPDLWVKAASTEIPITEEHQRWWGKALTGIRDLRSISLDRLADYVIRTRTAIAQDGQPLVAALGVALPSLRLPRESNLFKGVKEKGQASKWRAAYSSAAQKRACYLTKRNPSGLSLSDEDLRAAFGKVRETIPAQYHPAILSFIEAPSGWTAESAALAECEWEDIKPLFDGLRREQFKLGPKTLAFYDDREDGLITTSERDYLIRLTERKTTQAEDEDRLFYEAHRQELREDRQLKSAWDKFIFGTPRETNDFLSGLAASMEALFSQGGPAIRRKLHIRCDRRSRKDFKDLNVDAGLYFSLRYRGLTKLLGADVIWEVGDLFEFPALVEGWRALSKPTINRSLSRAALQIKFVFELEVTLANKSAEVYTTALIWRFNPNQVSSEFVEDWQRLAQHPLVYCRAHRRVAGVQAQGPSVDLSDVRTFMPAFGQDSGSLVGAYKKVNDIASVWRKNLEHGQTEALVAPEVGRELRGTFEAFCTTYGAAIDDFVRNGLASPLLLQQAQLYGSLLDQICKGAPGDRNRDLLIRPLLEIGAVRVEGGRTTIIVAPWHPLRLSSLARKARRVVSLLHHLISAPEVHFGDARLFFTNLAEELAHAYYPEVVLGWNGSNPELLSLTDVVGDYTLHESPLVTVNTSEGTDENPNEGAQRVVELAQRYLQLYPHEQANLSIVLYNCDSARLPQAVVNRLSLLNDDDEALRCQVILRHRDGRRLQDVYRAIIEASGSQVDAYSASEANRDFMARLRIGIMADQASVPDPKDGCPADIAFSQDVIARHASIEWYREGAKPIDGDSLVPATWSRRRPATKDDMKSIVYLCCPVQTEEGWAFLTALTGFFKGDWDTDDATRLLPARQLDFRDNTTAQIFEETHNLANWVVNYDELLDRRQLLNQNVRVIRYKQSSTQGRNLVISSKASLGLLRSMVLRRIKDLQLDLDEPGHERLAARFIEDANDISGDIVLRAARRGRNASELMGVVLSRFLIREALGSDRHLGWYFLDDYADWLGQSEEQIADVLVLSPRQSSTGLLQLTVVVAEAKYIDFASLASKRKESQKQLRDTVGRLEEALFGNPLRLDRDLWLARLSDLLLDGIQIPSTEKVTLSEWRRALRTGQCEVRLQGYSHVFVSGPAGSSECSETTPIAQVGSSVQQVYSRAALRGLVQRYARSDRTGVPAAPTLEPDGSPEFRTPTTAGILSRAVWNPTAKDLVTSNPADDTRNLRSLGSPPDSPEDAVSSASARWAYAQVKTLLMQGPSPAEEPAALQWLEDTVNRTKLALQQFHLQSKLATARLTPNAALLKFVGSANLTVDQVARRRSEFLTTYGLDLIAIRPEPGLVALAVARPERQVVRLEELWRTWLPSCEYGNQDLLIGIREEDGGLLFLSPGRHHAPHTLIAGSTGSGKSVLMQNIILSIIATNTPEQARLILIDPKQGVDYFGFERLPHLDHGIIDSQDIAREMIEGLVFEMDRRYGLLRAARAANVQEYNAKVLAPLPLIWVVHDEFAEWMMVEDYKQAVANTVARLGVKARAAGIHLVFAAQRPDALVMPMQLRSNLGNRLILRVDSEGTSDIALGEKGAERLLGKGHLLAKLEGMPLCYAQVPFVTSTFIEAVVESITSRASGVAGGGPGDADS